MNLEKVILYAWKDSQFLSTPELYAGSRILGFLGHTMDPAARGKVETERQGTPVKFFLLG